MFLDSILSQATTNVFSNLEISLHVSQRESVKLDSVPQQMFLEQQMTYKTLTV